MDSRYTPLIAWECARFAELVDRYLVAPRVARGLFPPVCLAPMVRWPAVGSIDYEVLRIGRSSYAIHFNDTKGIVPTIARHIGTESETLQCILAFRALARWIPQEGQYRNIDPEAHYPVRATLEAELALRFLG